VIDVSLLHAVVQLRQPWLDDLMIFATALGTAGFLWLVVAGIGLVFPGRRAAAWRLVLVLLLTTLVVDGLIKPMVNRPRPSEADPTLVVLDARPVTSSFPSGHTARAVAGAVAASEVFPALTWGFWPAALAIAASRVYLAAHWPSDVLSGAVVGLLCAWFALGGRRRVLRR